MFRGCTRLLKASAEALSVHSTGAGSCQRASGLARAAQSIAAQECGALRLLLAEQRSCLSARSIWTTALSEAARRSSQPATVQAAAVKARTLHTCTNSALRQPAAAAAAAVRSAVCRRRSTLAADVHLHQAARQAAASTKHDLAQGLSTGTRKALAAWLGVCTAWVGSLVVLGGLTRLTRSGLSMTDWKFTGEAPPRSEEEWHAEFAKYQASPEFKAINRSMQVEDFKFIYWMEWAHRMWGRTLGLIFIVPAVYFTARGAVKGPLAARLGLLGAMGGAQGLVGWWMVRSGLEEPTEAHATPRVSPYRLASHLASAFTIFGLLLWTTLSLSLPPPPSPAAAAAGALRALRRHVLPLTGLIALTAASGAFVAGNDAGHAYNTFPLMNGHWIPEDYVSHEGWRNAFESTGAVQLHHRCLALTTLAATMAVWAAHVNRRALPRDVKRLLHALAGMAGVQVSLGITALLSYVPPGLGAAHQAGALTLLSISLGLLHTLHRHLPESAMAGAGSLPGPLRRGLPGLATAAGVAGVAAYVSWT